MQTKIYKTVVTVFLILFIAFGGQNCAYAEDVFENFETGPGGFSEADGFAVSDGRYLFKGDGSDDSKVKVWAGGTAPGGTTPESDNSNYFQDFFVSVDTTWESGAKDVVYGIILCSHENTGGTPSYVRFLMETETAGGYKIDKREGDSYETIVDPHQSSLVNRINGAKNRLSVMKRGNEFSFYINDAKVSHHTIEGFDGGGIGLSVNHQLDVSFDNFLITSTDDPWIKKGGLFSMNVRGQLSVDGVKIETPGYVIAAFGPEGDYDCRGVADIVESSGEWRYNLPVSSDKRLGEDITFKTWNRDSGQFYNTKSKVSFKADTVFDMLTVDMRLCGHPEEIFEDFEIDAGGFWETGGFSVSDGRYLFKGNETNTFWIDAWAGGSDPGGIAPRPDNSNYFKDFFVSVDTLWEDGPENIGYGFTVCTYENTAKTVSYVRFLVAAATGIFKIDKNKADDSLGTIVDWTGSSLINRTNGSKNRLSIMKKGNAFTFYINDAKVSHQTIEGFDGGGIGLYMNNQLDVSFDNFRITSTDDPWVPKEGLFTMDVRGQICVDGLSVETPGYVVAAFGPDGDYDCRGIADVVELSGEWGYDLPVSSGKSQDEDIIFKIWNRNSGEFYNTKNKISFKANTAIDMLTGNMLPCGQPEEIFENFETGLGGFPEDENFSVSDGRYLFDGDGSSISFVEVWTGGAYPGGTTPEPDNSNYFQNFFVSADTTWEGGAKDIGYGITLCTYENAGGTPSYVRLLIAAETGAYKIDKREGDSTETIADSSTPLINSGSGAKNRLSVMKRGNAFTFSINDITVGQQSINGFDGGGIGFSVNHQLDVSFDNFRITPINDSPLPDTGQTKCYDNEKEISCPQPGEDFYGQDAHYPINPQSYTKLDAQGNDLPDDAAEWMMVRDNVAGLIWEIKTDDGSVHDKNNMYTWYDSNPGTNGGDPGTPGDGTDTGDFINALNTEKFGGFSDWRLPTIRELSSIVNIGRYNPAIDTEYFANIPDYSLINTYSTLICYWSSTTNANSPGQAWFTMFAGGSNDYYYYRDTDKSKSLYVRAVRGGQDWKSDHFADNGNGTITDTHTGLMWQKQAYDLKMNWKDALGACENLSLAGYEDWRLPSIGELRSILNYAKHAPISDLEYFPDVKKDNYWASTSDTYGPERAWYVNFNNGIDGSEDKSDIYYVRAVRGAFPKAGITGTPDSPTEQRDATLRINGDGVVSYRYKVNEGNYSEEIPASEPINLTNLINKTHTVHVLGKNLYGTWQPEDHPTTVSWIVTSLFIDITSPEDGMSVDDLKNIIEIRGTASAKEGSVIEIQITDGEYYLDSQGRFSSDEAWLLADGTESWSFNVSAVSWKDKDYTVTARNTDSTGDVLTDSVTILACRPSTITCELTSDAINIGDNITLSGYTDSPPSEAGKGVSIEFTSPSGEEIKKSANANIDGAFDYSLGCGEIQAAGIWMVRVSWAGDDDLCGAVSETYSFTVSKAFGSVSFDTDSSVIKLGESVAISGRLTPETECEMDLSDIPIVLNISDPNDGMDIQTVHTDEGGHLLIQDYAGLGRLGEWTITAALGKNDLFETDADQPDSVVEINVKETAGYAIIIQGYDINEEELETYNKTTQLVYTALAERELLDDDINYLNYDTALTGVDDISSKINIEDAVTQWAANKMNGKPANLYIVMVNHGRSDGNFLLHNSESITPGELGGWLDTLRENLEDDAKDQEIVVIMGFCYSGLFIQELSGENRVIIASSDLNKRSMKEPEGDGEIRQGEYFTAEFFKAVSDGKSIESCFEVAKNIGTIFNQNPLLDDNGDGEGSNALSLDADADGSESSDIYIGTGISDFNAIDEVSITEVAPTIFLGVDETSTDQIWARVVNRDRLKSKSIWVNIKRPNSEIIDTGGTGQVEIDLEGPFFSDANDAGGRYEWHNLGNPFSEPGIYQIFYYARDKITGEVSPFTESRLYKAKAGNHPPSPLALISPQNDENIMTDTYLQVKLDWTDATDSEGDNFSYTLLLSRDSDFSNPICIEDLICSIRLISKFDGIDTGRYYWKVQAIDKYGAFEESETGEFTIFDANPQEMWVGGHITDIFTHLSIPNVFINILGASSSFQTDMTGCYLEKVDEGSTLSVEVPGYDSASWTVSSALNQRRNSTDDLMSRKNFKLTPSCGDTVTGDILRDCAVDLKDAVLTLKILSGQTGTPYKEAALDGKKITLGDAVSILRTISKK